ncbi:MAG: hypothetical protein ACTHK8_09905 [Ginsengibacter sp.]
MKKMNHTFALLLFIFSIAGCSKTEKKIEITDKTYIIKASNLSVDDIPLSIKTSLDPQRKIIIPKNTTKDIYVNASAGEYVKFTVTKAACEYRILDSRGTTIALYGSLPPSSGNTTELDFIAFPPADPDKDVIKYKTGMAKKIGDNLVGRPYLLHERYYLENGIKSSSGNVQEPCTYNDEYVFVSQRGEFGNFNPERMIFSTKIDQSKSSCSYGAGIIVPPNVSVFSNGSDTLYFPIWDRLAVDGPPSSMIYRKLIIDSINTNGTLTLHRGDNSKKEVFVYEPK